MFLVLIFLFNLSVLFCFYYFLFGLFVFCFCFVLFFGVFFVMCWSCLLLYIPTVYKNATVCNIYWAILLIHCTLYSLIADNHHEIASSYLGFSVYVSNTTDKQQGVLCFKDNGFNESTKPAVFTTKCTVHGQYVIYNNEKLAGIENPDRNSAYVMNNLCEVEVYGKNS